MKYFQVDIILIALCMNLVAGGRKIYYGQPAKEGTFGHVVKINIIENNITGVCTGSIIHEDWVLTAAHCVCTEEYLSEVLTRLFSVTPEILPANAIHIIAGVVKENRSDNEQIRAVKEIHIHEKYTNVDGKPDLSVIKVDKPFYFTPFVKKIEFFASAWPQNHSAVWENCVSCGWGITDHGPTDQLMILPTNAKHGRGACPCIEKFYKLKRYVCLKRFDRRGVCFGDSGGPLTCNNKVVGVLHAGLDKRHCSYTQHPDFRYCGHANVYAIYIYTCPYLNWISKHVPDVPNTPQSCAATRFASPIFKTILSFIYILFIIL